MDNKKSLSSDWSKLRVSVGVSVGVSVCAFVCVFVCFIRHKHIFVRALLNILLIKNYNLQDFKVSNRFFLKVCLYNILNLYKYLKNIYMYKWVKTRN